jgi:hypothetical protein
MGCCGRTFGRTRRRTSSIYDKIAEEKEWQEYYKKKNTKDTGLVWFRGKKKDS